MASVILMCLILRFSLIICIDDDVEFGNVAPDHRAPVKRLMKMAENGETINGVLQPMKDEFLGDGAVGFVYSCLLIQENITAAVKFVPKSKAKKAYNEYRMYKYMDAVGNSSVEKYGIPSIYYYGDWEQEYVITAFTEYEDNVEDFFKIDGFSYKCFDILIMILNFIRASKYMHSMGILHNDIKPENLLIDSCQIYINDFNLATTMTNPGKGCTSKFASINWHKNVPRCAMDDWESFLYTICSLVGVDLEWFQWLKIGENRKKNKTERASVCGKMKMNTTQTLERIQAMRIDSPAIKEMLTLFAKEVFSGKKFPDYDHFFELIIRKIDELEYGTRCFSWTQERLFDRAISKQEEKYVRKMIYRSIDRMENMNTSDIANPAMQKFTYPPIPELIRIPESQEKTLVHRPTANSQEPLVSGVMSEPQDVIVLSSDPMEIISISSESSKEVILISSGSEEDLFVPPEPKDTSQSERIPEPQGSPDNGASLEPQGSSVAAATLEPQQSSAGGASSKTKKPLFRSGLFDQQGTSTSTGTPNIKETSTVTPITKGDSVPVTNPKLQETLICGTSSKPVEPSSNTQKTSLISRLSFGPQQTLVPSEKQKLRPSSVPGVPSISRNTSVSGFTPNPEEKSISGTTSKSVEPSSKTKKTTLISRLSFGPQQTPVPLEKQKPRSLSVSGVTVSRDSSVSGEAPKPEKTSISGATPNSQEASSKTPRTTLISRLSFGPQQTPVPLEKQKLRSLSVSGVTPVSRHSSVSQHTPVAEAASVQQDTLASGTPLVPKDTSVPDATPLTRDNSDPGVSHRPQGSIVSRMAEILNKPLEKSKSAKRSNPHKREGKSKRMKRRIE